MSAHAQPSQRPALNLVHFHNPAYQTAVVIGASAGGSDALEQILPLLPADFPAPLIVVQHLHPQQEGAALLYRCQNCALQIKEAEEKEAPQPGYVYFAPPNYHLLIEAIGGERIFSLSIDERVHFTRPSIDVLFESAVDAYGSRLIGIILSGANQDGAHGLARLKQAGGRAIVQTLDSASASQMPEAALAATPVDDILPPAEIGRLLARLGQAMSPTSPQFATGEQPAP